MGLRFPFSEKRNHQNMNADTIECFFMARFSPAFDRKPSHFYGIFL